jgi:MFS family permease
MGPVARSYVVVAAAMSGDSLVHFLFPPYLDTLGFSVDLIGFLMAVGSVASLASRLPGGVLYRGSRARALLVGALVLAIVTTLATPFVHDAVVFGALRVAIGFSYGIVTTTNLARFIEALPPGTNRPRAMGYYSSALAVGLVMGNAVGGFVAEWFGYLVAFESAVAFYVLAIVAGATLPAPARREAYADPSPMRCECRRPTVGTTEQCSVPNNLSSISAYQFDYSDSDSDGRVSLPSVTQPVFNRTSAVRIGVYAHWSRNPCRKRYARSTARALYPREGVGAAWVNGSPPSR